MKTTILEYANGEIETCLHKIRQGEDKMAANFENGFDWGYPEEIYANKYMGRNLQYFTEFISKQPERAGEWLQHSVQAIEKRLFDGKFQENSTSEFSRIAYRIKLESDAKLRELYVRWLKWINEKETPIL